MRIVFAGDDEHRAPQRPEAETPQRPAPSPGRVGLAGAVGSRGPPRGPGREEGGRTHVVAVSLQPDATCKGKLGTAQGAASSPGTPHKSMPTAGCGCLHFACVMLLYTSPHNNCSRARTRARNWLAAAARGPGAAAPRGSRCPRAPAPHSGALFVFGLHV